MAVKVSAEALEAALRLIQGADEGVSRLFTTSSGIPEERFVTSRLSALSPTGREMSEAMQSFAENPRTLTAGQFPKVARDIGLQPVEGFVYGAPNQRFRSPSSRAMGQMESNLETLLDNYEGDPNFYRDLNALLRVSAPEVDPTLAALTFAPFSAGSAVRENARLWQRFMENPGLFPGRFPSEGSRTAGPAWRSALRVLSADEPTIATLSSSGKIVKVPSFAENIAFPETSMRATIDRHAAKNLIGSYLPDLFAPNLQDEPTYRALESAFQNVASRRGMLPSEVQSSTWDTWRNIAQANPGASMLSPEEFYRLSVPEAFSMEPAARREALRSLFESEGRESDFLKAAGLL